MTVSSSALLRTRALTSNAWGRHHILTGELATKIQLTEANSLKEAFTRLNVKCKFSKKQILNVAGEGCSGLSSAPYPEAKYGVKSNCVALLPVSSNPSNLSELPNLVARSLLPPGPTTRKARGVRTSAAADTATLEGEVERGEDMVEKHADGRVSKTPAQAGVVVRDKEGLERKKRAIRAAGPGKLQVVSDFDMTLTKFRISGQKGESCHSLLSQKDDRYNQMRRELYKHYYPMEIDQSIPYERKVKLMEEWYAKSHATLLEGGLTLEEIRDSVATANVAFRDGTAHLFEVLDAKHVPVLIFSAGLADVLEEILRQKLHRTFGNVRVVSNRMRFNSAGRLEGFVGSLIHSLNKNEHAIALAGPMHDEQGRPLDDLKHSKPSDADEEPTIDGLDGRSVVAGRNNVILLGDHLGDLGMSRGVDVAEQISIAFLNDKVEENLDAFADSFDIVLLGDGSMDGVVSLIQDIL